MSMWLLMYGYILSFGAALLGCIAIARSRTAFSGLNWLTASISAALVGAILIFARSAIPAFFSIVLANEVFFAAYVLLHQAIASILGSSRRYIWLSIGLSGALLIAFLDFTYVSDNFSARILARTAVVVVQILISTVVVFRHRDPALRSPLRVVGWTLIAYNAVQITRLAFTLIWPPPSADLMHPDAVQAFFSFLNCLLGLCSFLAVLWLALWGQRHDLQKLAFTDVLTGLMNRRAFDEIMKQEIRHSQQSGEPLALMLIDIDSFKAINDDYGHLIGDEVIRQVGRALQANTRPGDIVGRFGGEEFVMLLRDVLLDDAEVIAQRLRVQVAVLRELPQGIHVTVSIGLAICDVDDTAESLLKRSDDALYFAKRSGRNRVSVGLANMMPEVSVAGKK